MRTGPEFAGSHCVVAVAAVAAADADRHLGAVRFELG